MLAQIISGEWFDQKANRSCIFYWTDSDKSIGIEFTSGTNKGNRNSHQFVKLYHTAEELADCTRLCYQSNLFTSLFILEEKNGPLEVDSNVFGKMNLVRK